MISIRANDLQVDILACLERIPVGELALVVDEDNQPIAEIKPLARPANTDRPFGLYAGKINVPVDFDAPLPDAVLREFETL